MNKLEILKQKLVTYYIKKAILDEMNKTYYKNSNNIEKIIDLGSKCVNLSATDVSYQIKNITYYKNGFYIYNNYTEAAAAFPDEFKDKEIVYDLIAKGR